MQSICENAFPVLWRHIQLNVLPLHVNETVPNAIDAQTIADLFLQTPECVHALLSPNTADYTKQLAKIVRALVDDKQWEQLSAILLDSSILRTYHVPEIVHLKDRAIELLACNAVEQYHQSLQTTNGVLPNQDSLVNTCTIWSLVMSIRNCDVRSRVLVRCLALWDIVTCVRHLQEHLRLMPKGHMLKEVVEEKLETMKVYQQVSVFCVYLCHLVSCMKMAKLQNNLLQHNIFIRHLTVYV